MNDEKELASRPALLIHNHTAECFLLTEVTKPFYSKKDIRKKIYNIEEQMVETHAIRVSQRKTISKFKKFPSS